MNIADVLYKTTASVLGLTTVAATVWVGGSMIRGFAFHRQVGRAARPGGRRPQAAGAAASRAMYWGVAQQGPFSPMSDRLPLWLGL